MPRSVVRIAHRGASGLYPENTLLAYRRAIEQGVDMLEVDVHRNEADEIRGMVQLGVPGLMTDRPDVLNNVLNDSASVMGAREQRPVGPAPSRGLNR